MELNDFQLQEGGIIDTRIMNKFFHDGYTDISRMYDRTFGTLGKVEIINTSLKLIDRSNKRVIDVKGNSLPPEGIQRIDSLSNIIYPTSINDLDKANINTNHNLLTSSEISKLAIWSKFSNNKRIKQAGVNIIKSSHNYIFTARPQHVYESNITDVITGNFPYLVQFIGNDVVDGQINFEITSNAKVSRFNTIEYTPFPIIGMMEIESVHVEDKEIQSPYGYIEFNNKNKFERSGSAYIPFSPISGNRVNISVNTDNRIESVNGVTVGIELLEAFETTYSEKSYFGYKLTPQENRRLTNLAINHPWSSHYRGGLELRIYENKDDFNNITNNYLVNIDEALRGTVNLLKGNTYYVLVVLNIKNNYPILLESLDLITEPIDV